MNARHVAVLAAVAASLVVACGDVAPMLTDASTMLADAAEHLDGSADAQIPPGEPYTLTCPDNYAETVVILPGTASEITRSSTWTAEVIPVADPTNYLVEFCGESIVRDPSSGSCEDPEYECTGAPPPDPRCELRLPEYTDTTIHVICSSDTTTQGRRTTTTYESIRLIPH